jgi:uncharacterized protein (TIGR02594 family)
MTAFNHSAFMSEWRRRQPRIPQSQYDTVMASLEVGLGSDPKIEQSASSQSGEPAWLVEARSHIGTKEIPGKAHNPKIVQWWRNYTTLFRDDETAWCGGFMDHNFRHVGIAPPANSFRAKTWASWGGACTAQMGAVGVKARAGGNHVFLIVGITSDGRYFKCLGGNQGNMVSIMDIAVSDVTAIRWPHGVPQLHIKLPSMPRGTISRNEA